MESQAWNTFHKCSVVTVITATLMGNINANFPRPSGACLIPGSFFTHHLMIAREHILLFVLRHLALYALFCPNYLHPVSLWYIVYTHDDCFFQSMLIQRREIVTFFQAHSQLLWATSLVLSLALSEGSQVPVVSYLMKRPMWQGCDVSSQQSRKWGWRQILPKLSFELMAALANTWAADLGGTEP